MALLDESSALTHKFQLPSELWLRDAPLVNEMFGVHEAPVVQQYCVEATPEESAAVTVTLTSALAHERAVGLKVMVGPPTSLAKQLPEPSL